MNPAAVGQAPNAIPKPAQHAVALRSKVLSAKTSSFDAALELLLKSGEAESQTVARFDVKHAIAPGGKYLLRVSNKSRLEYLVVSDGLHTWAYASGPDRYVELEAIASGLAANPQYAFLQPIARADAEPILCSGLVAAILGSLDPAAPSIVDMKTFTDGSTEAGGKQPHWLTILSPPSAKGGHTLTEVAVDLETLVVSDLNWRKAFDHNEERTLSSLHAVFSRFELDAPVPASYFAFAMDATRKVDQLPIPGLFGTSVVGRIAPELSVSGASETMVLTFTTNKCPPCQKQRDALSAIRPQANDRKVALLEVGSNDAKLHALFKVHFVPTTVIINKDRVVTHYLPGFQNEQQLKALLPKGTAR